jgi:hypothetical protein
MWWSACARRVTSRRGRDARGEAGCCAGVGRAAGGTAKREDDQITEREVTVLLADFATVWNELFPVEQARVVQLLVERVDVREEAIEVRIRAEGLASLVAELRQPDKRRAA